MARVARSSCFRTCRKLPNQTPSDYQPISSPDWDQLRFDKYEGKMLFWVEHEVTAQYESSKTRTRREQVNFDTDEPDATLSAASAPMTLNMDDVRNMSLGRGPTCFLWFPKNRFKNPSCMNTLCSLFPNGLRLMLDIHK